VEKCAYYNEHDPFAAAWLRNLIDAGHIAPGDVDERDIRDVRPSDIDGYAQHHFFAGIGVWSYALRRAGWPDDRPVTTGSCPCQPFSAAGGRGGFDDERHLWPAFYHLISERRFPVVLGEQVASKDGLAWLDLVQADMEGAGYAGGALDLCSAGFGAPHIRQRLYFAWLADTVPAGRPARRSVAGRGPAASSSSTGLLAVSDCRERIGLADGEGRQRDGQAARREQGDSGAQPGSEASGVAHHPRLQGRDGVPERTDQLPAGPSGVAERLADASSRAGRDAGAALGTQESVRRAGHPDGRGGGDALLAGGAAGSVANTNVSGERERAPSREQPVRVVGSSSERLAVRDPGPVNGFWRDADWLLCRNPDGEPAWRAVESGSFPLANGIANRMGLLRGYGNAVNAEVTKGFVESVMVSIDALEVV